MHRIFIAFKVAVLTAVALLLFSVLGGVQEKAMDAVPDSQYKNVTLAAQEVDSFSNPLSFASSVFSTEFIAKNFFGIVVVIFLAIVFGVVSISAVRSWPR